MISRGLPGSWHGILQISHDAMCDTILCKCHSKHVRISTDQQSFFYTREERCKGIDPTNFCDASGDPNHTLVAAKRTRCGICVGGLAIIDKTYAGYTCDHLLPMRKSGESLDAACNISTRNAESHCHPARSGGVLRVMTARQGMRNTKINNRSLRIPEYMVLAPKIGATFTRNTSSMRHGTCERAAVIVVNPEYGGVQGGLTCENLLFGS